MKPTKLLSVIATATMMLTAVSCGQKKDAKVLVLYYSQTSNTEQVANEIASRLNADIEAIVAVNPYDGDFHATIERCLQEREGGILPEIQPVAANGVNGYPIPRTDIYIYLQAAQRLHRRLIVLPYPDGKQLHLIDEQGHTIDTQEYYLQLV